MAGDWIKMRGNLWDDPRVGRLAELTKTSEATVIGGLYWLWSSADQHSTDGVMPGLTMRQVDKKSGIKGFAQALADIGWLTDDPAGIIIPNFHEHNGESAKERAEGQKRKANWRKNAGQNADKCPTKDGTSVPQVVGQTRDMCPEKSEAREEKREEANPTDASHPAGKAPPSDPVETIFQIGTPLLTQAGVKDSTARSLLGKLRKTHGDLAVSWSVERMAKERPSDPAAWLVASLSKPAERSKATAKTAAEWVNQLLPRKPDELTIDHDGTPQRVD